MCTCENIQSYIGRYENDRFSKLNKLQLKKLIGYLNKVFNNLMSITGNIYAINDIDGMKDLKKWLGYCDLSAYITQLNISFCICTLSTTGTITMEQILKDVKISIGNWIKKFIMISEFFYFDNIKNKNIDR